MKKVLLTLLLLITSLSFSQSIISKDSLKLKSNWFDKDQLTSFPIINKDTDELTLFIFDRKHVYLNKYDTQFKIKKRQKYVRPTGFAKDILEGIGSKEGDYTFLMASSSKMTLELFRIDSKTQDTLIIKSPFTLKNEKYLNSFTHNNQICVISTEAKNNALKIRKIKIDGSITALTYDLSKERFINKKNRELQLHKTFKTYNRAAIGDRNLEFIDSSLPNAIEKTSKVSKFYKQDNTIIISLDINNYITQLIRLQLEKEAYEIVNINKPPLVNPGNISATKFIHSNSFLFENKLHQIVNTKEQMVFAITDINSKEKLKQISLQQKDSITFKNTPIIQLNGMYDSYREMEKSKKFLRKIASGNVGISVNKNKKDTLTITIGAIKKISGSGPMMGAGMGGVAGMPAGFMTPAFSTFYSYSNTKSTYIDCLFDNDFNHLQGAVTPNAFDNIRDFSDNLIDNKAETIFKYKNYLVYGYYHIPRKKYYLRKFE